MNHVVALKQDSCWCSVREGLRETWLCVSGTHIPGSFDGTQKNTELEPMNEFSFWWYLITKIMRETSKRVVN